MTGGAVSTAKNRGGGGRRPPRGRPFEPNQGDKRDERINRKGRPPVPRSLQELRDTIQAVLDEELNLTDDGKKTIQRLRAMLRVMTTSKHPQDRKTLLEFAYGKAPQTIDITSAGQPITTPVFVYLPDNKRDAGTGPKGKGGQEAK